MAVLTWIIPAGQYSAISLLILQEPIRLLLKIRDLEDVLMAPIRAMLGKEPTSAAIDVAFFILMVGGFLG